MNPVGIACHVRLDLREVLEALDESLEPRICVEAAGFEERNLLDLMPHAEVRRGHLIATGEPLAHKLLLASVQIIRQALEVGWFQFLEVRIVAQAREAPVEVHALFNNDIDERGLCGVFPQQLMFAGQGSGEWRRSASA